MSKYRRIRYEDRCQIYALSERGASQESIARILGVSQSAVSSVDAAEFKVSAAIGSSQRKRRLMHDRRYEVSPASSWRRSGVRSRRSCARCAGRRADQRLAKRTGHQAEP